MRYVVWWFRLCNVAWGSGCCALGAGDMPVVPDVRDEAKLPVGRGVVYTDLVRPGASLSHCAMPLDAVSGSLREAVLAGPGAPVALDRCRDVAELLFRPRALAGALAAAGHRDVRSRALTGAATAAAVLGLCLYCGEGQNSVLARIWALTAPLRPGFGVGSPEVVSASALSRARARLPVQVMESLFVASAAVPVVETVGLRVFDMIATAFDGTVFDLDPDPAVSLRYATPSGGSCPQARVVTLVGCGTRRVLAARVGSSAVSEQVLWDRMVTTLQPGTINFCDRNLCATRRFIAFSAQSGGIGGLIPGSNGLPGIESFSGDWSMPENRRSCPDEWSGAPGDPHDMAKAGLPASQSPVVSRSRPPESRLLPAPPPCTGIEVARCNLPGMDNVQRGRVRR